MIIQKELYQISKRLKIQPSVLDKDWILGHFLNAMFSFDIVKNMFVFKGGTSLKKCYFHDYRFSEDLDFTLIDDTVKIDETLFEAIIAKAQNTSNAGLYLKGIKQQIYNDKPQGYEVTVLFWGADHKPNQVMLPVERWQTKIKIDISFSEKILLAPLKKKIFHPYSDSKILKNMVSVYPINEIVSEKLRALLQRNRPRDIYDLYFLSKKIERNQYIAIHKLLIRKANDKNITNFEFNDFINAVKARKNKRAWESSLGHHLAINKLLAFDTAYIDVSKFVFDILNTKP